MNLTQNLKERKNQSEGEKRHYNLAGTNSVIKIILNHTHILRTLFMFPYNWTFDFGEAINTTFGFISPGVSNALSIECIVKKSNIGIEFLYFKLISNLVVPFIVGVIYIICIFINQYIKKRIKLINNGIRRDGFFISIVSIRQSLIIRKIVKSMRNKLSIESVFIIVFMLSWVDIAHAVGNTLFHVNIGYDNIKSKRLLWQPNIDFESPQHKNWIFLVSAPSVIVFGFLFPAYLIYRFKILFIFTFIKIAANNYI